MGSKFSKRSSEPSHNSNQYTSELSSYEAACRIDPELQSFDEALHGRANRVFSAVSQGAGPDNSLSFTTLMEVTGGLIDLNREVVTIILGSKKDVWNSPELFQIVEEFFETSLQSLDFCTCLENCLKNARESQILIQLAIQRFEQQEDGDNKYSMTLEELRKFKAAGDPFSGEFFQLLESVRKQHLSMLDKLLQSKNRLDERLKSVKSWRKISSVIFVATFVAVMICSVVAAAVSAPPVLTALAAAAMVPVGSMGKWLDSLFKGYQDVIRGERELLSSMQVGSYVVIKDLDTIRVLAERLEGTVGAMRDGADFVLGDGEAVRIGMEEIKKKLEVFMKNVEDLGEQADGCTRDIRMARTVVLQRIIKPPVSGN